MKIGNYLKSIIVFCLLPLLFLTASTANAAPLSCGGWKVVTSPNPGVPDGLGAVAAVSATDVWAVGSSGLQSQTGQTVIEHWNGTQWSVVKSPSPGSEFNTLTGVAVVSANNVWAVGWQSSLGVAETLIEHWNGTQWSVVKSPSPASAGNELFSVATVSATDVWTVGFILNNTATGPVEQTLIEHWNGTQWSVVKSPNPSSQTNGLTGVTATSATNAWAVGFAVNSSGIWQTLTEHWNGTQWRIVTSPSPGSQINYLSSVATISTTSAWAVGYADNQTLTEQWNGTQWSVVKSSGPGPVSNSLLGVVMVSATNVWSVGYYEDSNFVSHTLTEHWNGTQWSVVTSPSPGSSSTQLEGVAAISSSNVWAVGHADSMTLIEHYC
jgi:hypothetical protein